MRKGGVTEIRGEEAERGREGLLPGDEGRRTERREKVKKGQKMRRRRRSSSVGLFSKCKELLVTMFMPSLPLCLPRTPETHVLHFASFFDDILEDAAGQSVCSC